MIKKLRIRFIAASMLALAAVLLVILGGINLMSYRKVIQDADSILKVLSDNGGRFPQRMDWSPDRKASIRKGLPAKQNFFGTPDFSPETPFESRFFLVTFNEAGQVTEIDIRMIAAVDQETAVQCGEKIIKSGCRTGFWGDFRYLADTQGGNTSIIFLDCSKGLTHFRATLLSSAATALGGLGAVLILLIIFSGRIVKPVTESYEKQKRFITDAGHEIKTPLTVIGADLDLAEMEAGENEWLQDIRMQVRRLTDLTNDLIVLSRMDEAQILQEALEFPLSDTVEEAAQSFHAPAISQGKTFSISIQPMLSITGSEKDIRKLVGILLDNAVKHSASDGDIRIKLEKKGRHILLTVSNSIAESLSEQQLSQLFDRFYRTDPARSTSGGYGLGLAIAQGIVSAHKGTIQASADGGIITITVSLPA